MGSETAAVKYRVKGLQLGVKMETQAKVNPSILNQVFLTPAYGYLLYNGWCSVMNLGVLQNPFSISMEKAIAL